MAKVSVIIPVYRVEDFIGKCLDSLVSQTMDDVEYIFVDDASPDHGDCCAAYVGESGFRITFKDSAS